MPCCSPRCLKQTSAPIARSTRSASCARSPWRRQSFPFGLTLLGEAIVVWIRTGGATGVLNPPATAGAKPRQPDRARFADVIAPLEPASFHETDGQTSTALQSPGPAPEAVPAGRPAILRDDVDLPRPRIDQPAGRPVSTATVARSVADALQRHHEDHHNRHHRDHKRERP